MGDIDQISDPISDADFDAALGDEDVPEVANEPESSDESVVAAPETDTEDEPEDVEEKPPVKDETPPVEEPSLSADTSEEQPEKLNWDSAPKSFREQYDAVKSELKNAQSTSLQEKFFESPEAFLTELNGLSTSQYQQTTQQIVQKGIEALPDEFAEYLAQVAPASVAKTLSKLAPEVIAAQLGLDMPIDKVKRIIAQVKAQDLEDYLNDNDDGTAPPLETPKAAQAAEPAVQPMTQEEINRLVEQKVAEADKPKRVNALEGRIYSDIMKPVEALLEEANLRPLPTDSDEEKEYKEFVAGTVIKHTFEYLMDDEKNAPRAQKMVDFIQNLDEAGAKHLASTAKILAEEFAGKKIELLTGQRAKAKTKGTAAKTPPKKVPSTGAVAAFGNGNGQPPRRVGDLSDADFESAGM